MKGVFTMTHAEILATVDHTLLAQEATWEDIKIICDDAIHFGTASVCIPLRISNKQKNMSEIN